MIISKKPNFNYFELPLFAWGLHQPEAFGYREHLANRYKLSLPTAKVVSELNFGGGND